MMSIVQSILANPGKYSLGQLKQGVEDGVIPAYIGVPIIQEMMKNQARMTAMGQEQMPPVMDQIMAQTDQGLEALPSNLPQEYAGGGIIAFGLGGSTGQNNLSDAEIATELELRSREANNTSYGSSTPTGQKARPPAGFTYASPEITDEQRLAKIKTFADQYKGLLPEKDPRLTAYETSIVKTPEQLDARRNQDLYMSLAQFGLGLAGSKSRTLAGGISEASEKVLPSVQAALLSRRTAEDAQLRTQADMARADRTEGIAALTGGLNLYSEDERRKNAILVAQEQQNKEFKPATGAEAYVAAYVRGESHKPGNQKSIDQLTQEGYVKYPGFITPQMIAQGYQGVALQGQGVQQNIATGSQTLTAAQQFQQTVDKANDNYLNASNNRKDPIAIESRRLKIQDDKNRTAGAPTTLQLEFRNKTIQDMVNAMSQTLPTRSLSPINPPPIQNGLPPGAPSGSTIGKNIAGKGTEVILNGKVIGYAN